MLYMSEKNSNESFHFEGDAGNKIDGNEVKHVDFLNQDSLAEFKAMCKRVDYESEEECKEFLHQFYCLVNNWNGRLPNLEEFFCPADVDWLLSESVICDDNAIEPGPIIDFVIRTGYKDQPNFDEEGKPLPHRTTPIHFAARRKEKLIIVDLFKIYDSFEVNYIDVESGLTHLHVACEYGCDDVVEKFLELGQNPNCYTPKFLITPLFLTLLNGHQKTAELLVRGGADPNAATAVEMTPLHVICRREDDSHDLLKMFFEITDDLQHKVQVDAQDKWGNRPLHLALLNNNREVAEFLLRRGVDLNSPNNKGSTPLDIIYKKNYDEDFLALFFKISNELKKKVYVDIRDKSGNTLLHRALLERNKKMVESLLRHGADTNDANSIGLSPVHLICLGDDVGDFLEWFFRMNDEMQKTVRVDAQDNLGRTSLHLALEFDNEEAVKLLLKRGASPNIANNDGSTPLHLICNARHDAYEMAEIFFDEAVNEVVELDVRDEMGQTPLHLALSRGRKNLVRLLLTNGADPDKADNYGLTSWHLICWEGVDDDLLELFFNGEIKRAKQLDARDKSGRSPLHYALLANNKKAVEWLLRSGVDLNLADPRGSTPLHLISSEQVDDDMVEIFFTKNDMSKMKIEIDARDESGKTPLHQALLADNKKVALELLQIGADPNLADYEESTPLHLICERKHDDDLAETFFEISDRRLQSVRVNARDERDRTPLQLAVLNGLRKVAELLLKRGADSDLTSKGGMTPLHILCTSDDDDDLTKILFKINGDVEQRVDALDEWGDTPLHLALRHGKQKKADALLRLGADPSLANEAGRTALHLISLLWDEDRDAQLFVAITEELRRRGQIDARDKQGNTALHEALRKGSNQKAAFLLMRGADPNAANAGGSTPLHFIAARYSPVEDYNMVDELCKIAQDLNEVVRINAQDMIGDSPLHLALCNGKRKMAESLLRWGANPNLPNAKGSTPLHVICTRKNDDDLAEMFLETCNEVKQMVEVDARDTSGRTPLQWAVASLLPNTVNVLLDHGADLSNFVFPTEDYLAKNVPWYSKIQDFKLMYVAALLATVENLEKRGYELGRSDALTIMKLFAEHGLFQTSVDLRKCWYYYEDLVMIAKKITVHSSLSLYDLSRLRSEEVKRLFSYENYRDLVNEEYSHYYWSSFEGSIRARVADLCEKLSTGFFMC
ncbi:tankyrase-1-like [Trichogramma pretiosum]|uniref:tankyrase-1-like n=1 Tax=Trichogramma pretiosum TaxID=7493 RepID=UPI000C71A1F8|nr:tankyrase-1-like [Trichogramma pretiosum]